MKDGREGAERLMQRLGGSLVSWLTFQQSALRSKMYKERWMYGAIYEVAAARTWTIWPEYRCKIDNKDYFIDFVFYGDTRKHDRNDRLAAVEVSYITTGSKADKVGNDEAKLKAVDISKFEKKCRAKKFLLLTGKYQVLRDYCEKNVPSARQLFVDPEGHKGGWIYHSPYPYPDDKRWCVIILVLQT